MMNKKYLPHYICAGGLFSTALMLSLQGSDLKSLGTKTDPLTGEVQPYFVQAPRINPSLINVATLVTIVAGCYAFKEELGETGKEVYSFAKKRLSSDFEDEDEEETPVQQKPEPKKINLGKPSTTPPTTPPISTPVDPFEDIDYPEESEEEVVFSTEAFIPEPSFEDELIEVLSGLTRLKELTFQGKREGFAEVEYTFSFQLQQGVQRIVRQAQLDLQATKFGEGRLTLAGTGLSFRCKREDREFPAFDLPQKPDNARLPFLAGYDSIERTPVISDFGIMPNLGIGGSPQMGKDNYTKQIIASMMAYSSPDELRFAACDTSAKALSDYQALKDSPYLIESKYALSTDVAGATRLLNWTLDESSRRSELFKEAGVENIWQYKAKGYSLPCVVILFCETYDLLAGEPAYLKRVLSYIKTGRSQGMFAILSTQQPCGEAMPTGIRTSLSQSLMLKTNKDSVSQHFFNEEQPTSKLSDKGHGIYYDGAKYLDIQSAEVSSDLLFEYAHPQQDPQPIEEFVLPTNVIEFRRKA